MRYDLYEFGWEKLPNDMKDVIENFNTEYEEGVSCRWHNAEFDATELMRKVKSGEVFI